MKFRTRKIMSHVKVSLTQNMLHVDGTDFHEY
jgi:hypothetical protein